MGAAKAGLMTMTGGRFPGGRIPMHADADAPRSAGERDGHRSGRRPHLQQARRGVQVRQRDPRHHPEPPGGRPGRERGGRGLLRPPLPGGGLRAGRRRASRQPAELHRLQGHRRARPPLDAARGWQRPPVTGRCNRCASENSWSGRHRARARRGRRTDLGRARHHAGGRRRRRRAAGGQGPDSAGGARHPDSPATVSSSRPTSSRPGWGSPRRSAR